MICEPCRKGADIKTSALTPLGIQAKKNWHAKCKGCDCQHRIVKKVIV